MDKEPFVSLEIIEYLKNLFNTRSLLHEDIADANAHLGYMVGVQAVIEHLEALARRDD